MACEHTQSSGLRLQSGLQLGHLRAPRRPPLPLVATKRSIAMASLVPLHSKILGNCEGEKDAHLGGRCKGICTACVRTKLTKSRSSSSSMFPPANGTGDNCVTSGTCRAIQLASKREKSRYLLARCLSTDVLDSPGDCDVDCLFRAASVQGSPSSMDPFFFLKPLAFVRFYTRASWTSCGHRGAWRRVFYSAVNG